jgi:hypothetical protein
MAEGDIFRELTPEARESIKRTIQDKTGFEVLDTHIEKIGLYTKVGSRKWTTIEEGKYLDPQIAGDGDEEVLAIFKTAPSYYIVCTPNHGVNRNKPFIFRNQEIYMIEEET